MELVDANVFPCLPFIIMWACSLSVNSWVWLFALIDLNCGVICTLHHLIFHSQRPNSIGLLAPNRFAVSQLMLAKYRCKLPAPNCFSVLTSQALGADVLYPFHKHFIFTLMVSLGIPNEESAQYCQASTPFRNAHFILDRYELLECDKNWWVCVIKPKLLGLCWYWKISILFVSDAFYGMAYYTVYHRDCSSYIVFFNVFCL